LAINSPYALFVEDLAKWRVAKLLSLPGIFKNRRDVTAELFSHPLTRLVNLVENRVTISRRLPHHPAL
jgi:hypothetical protein